MLNVTANPSGATHPDMSPIVEKAISPTKPTQYVNLIDDLLAGTSARDLRSNQSRGVYSAAQSIVDIIGASPTNPLHQRGNHSLVDRLANVEEVFLQFCSDYGVNTSYDLDSYSLAEEDAEQAIEELTQIENSLKNFDTSDARMSGVKNAGLVRSNRSSLLHQISLVKTNIASKYEIEIVEKDQIEELIADIASGKSARYLQSRYGSDIKKNHSWRDRLQNISNIIYQEFKFDPLVSEGGVSLGYSPSNRESKRLSSMLDSITGVLENYSENIERHASIGKRARMRYLVLQSDIESAREEINSRYFLEGKSVKQDDEPFPFRLIQGKELPPTYGNLRTEPLVALDCRDIDERELVRTLWPYDVKSNPTRNKSFGSNSDVWNQTDREFDPYRELKKDAFQRFNVKPLRVFYDEI